MNAGAPGAASRREGPPSERAERLQGAAGAEPGRQSPHRQGQEREEVTLRRWPAQREAHGFLRLRDRLDRAEGIEVLCSVVNGTLSFRVEQEPGAGFNVLSAQVGVANMVLTVYGGKYTIFSIDSSVARSDTVFCEADNQEKRNKWLAIFRRMGVRLWADYGDGVFRCVRGNEFEGT